MDQSEIYFNYINQTITSGNESFLILGMSWLGLDDIKTQLGIADGELAKIKQIYCHFTLYSDSARFMVLPVLIKTEGTVTQGVSTTETDIETFLAAQCSEDFGFRIMGPMKQAQMIQYDAVNSHIHYRANLTVRLPQKIIKMLNNIMIEQEDTNFVLAVIGLCDYIASPYNNLAADVAGMTQFSVEANKIKIR